MKMMIWKEMRENLKWAVLAVIGLGLAETYGLNYQEQSSDYHDGGIISLCKSTYLMATTFGCALSGLFLGFIQILPEQRRDQWAMLLHRPVTRTVILRGKIAAGIILYLLATVPPFLVCLWLVATPGHYITPFVWGTVKGSLADMGAGLVYYFAALFMSLQRGSWIGARALGLFAALYLTAFITSDGDVYTEVYFHTALEATLLMGLVLFVAGWGAILSNGSFRTRPWLGKFALIVVVLYGLGGLEMMTKTISSFGFISRGNYGPEYQIKQDGVPVIVQRNADLSQTVTDLDRHVIDFGVNREQFLFMSQIAHLIGDPHGLDLSRRFPNYRGTFEYLSPIDQNDNIGDVGWFYLPKSNYFEGISKINKMPVKIEDRTGFKPWGAKPEPFQFDSLTTFGSYGHTPCLANEGRIISVIYLSDQKMFQMSVPNGDYSYHASIMQVPTAVPGIYDDMIVLVTARVMYVYDLKGNPIATLPYRYDVDQFGTIQMTMNQAKTQFYIMYGGSRWIDWSVRHLMDGYCDVVDLKGNTIKSYVLPALPVGLSKRNWTYYVFESSQSPAFWYGVVAYQKVCGLLGIAHYDDRGINPFYPDWSHPPIVGLRLLLVSLLWVPIALMLAWRGNYSLGRTLTWAVFVYVFNIGGLIAFWLVADWVPRVKCPQCGRKRLVEEETCHYCHAPWVAEMPSGIEIFEEKELVAEKIS